MNEPFAEIIRRHSRPLEPVPTGEPPRLSPLPDVQAVLFDIYGTLLVSGCGEIGSAVAHDEAEALQEALRAAELAEDVDARVLLETQQQVIRDEHARLRERSVDYPEVDIVAVWGEALRRGERFPGSDFTEHDLERLALEYECRVNPVWPMPHAHETLAELRDAGLTLGLVSNAQFFTPLLFPVLFGAELSGLGFEDELCVFSWRCGVAKPGGAIFEQATAALDHRRISTNRALYVGNDMLNDVAGAAQAGFRTALFAGDARSLRKRPGDERIAGIEPDLVLTDLHQLSSCVRVR